MPRSLIPSLLLVLISLACALTPLVVWADDIGATTATSLPIWVLLLAAGPGAVGAGAGGVATYRLAALDAAVRRIEVLERLQRGSDDRFARRDEVKEFRAEVHERFLALEGRVGAVEKDLGRVIGLLKSLGAREE